MYVVHALFKIGVLSENFSLKSSVFFHAECIYYTFCLLIHYYLCKMLNSLTIVELYCVGGKIFKAYKKILYVHSINAYIIV